MAEHVFTPYRTEKPCSVKAYSVNKSQAKHYLVVSVRFVAAEPNVQNYQNVIETYVLDPHELASWYNAGIDADKALQLDLFAESVMHVGRYDPFYPLNLPLFAVSSPINWKTRALISSLNGAPTPYPMPGGQASWFAFGYYDQWGSSFVAPTAQNKYIDGTTQKAITSGLIPKIGQIRSGIQAQWTTTWPGNVLDAYGITINGTPVVSPNNVGTPQVESRFFIYGGIRKFTEGDADNFLFVLKHSFNASPAQAGSVIPSTFTVVIEDKISQGDWLMANTNASSYGRYYKAELALSQLPLGVSGFMRRITEDGWNWWVYNKPNTGAETFLTGQPVGTPEGEMGRLLDAAISYILSYGVVASARVADAFAYLVRAAPLNDYSGTPSAYFNFCPSSQPPGGGDGGGGSGEGTGGGDAGGGTDGGTGGGTGGGDSSATSPDLGPIFTQSLYRYGFASDFPLWSWSSERHEYRAATKYNVVTRHPLMPRDLQDLYITNFSGAPVSYTTYEDRIVINGEPPFFVYFNPQSGQGAVPLSLPPVGEWSAVQKRLPLAGFEPENGLWVVKLGGYGEPDPTLAAARRDAVTPYDASPYVTRITGSAVELVVPHNVAQQVLSNVTFPIYVGYRTDTQSELPVKYAYVTQTSIEPGQSTLRVSLGMVEPKSFFNVDISSLEKSDALPRGVQSELDWVRWLFKLSGMYGLLSMEPGLGFKPLEFWTAAYPDGPGIPEEEMWDRFLNLNLTSTIGEIENLLQANLCTSVERPDGGLHIVPLVPNAHLTPAEFLRPEARVLFYGVDADARTYRRDPKLDIGSLEVNVDNSFAVVEVEGYSNTVQGNLVRTYATFVQGGRETQILQIDAGLWDNDSGRFEQMWETMKTAQGNYDDPDTVVPNVMDANEPGFRFSKLFNGVPKRVYYPESWYRLVGMDSRDPSNLEWESGDANYHVALEKYQFGLLTEQAAQGYDLDNYYNLLPENQKNFNKAQVLLGFVARGYASNVCGSVFGDPFYRLKLKAPDIDSATLSIVPLVGQPKDKFAPKWFPNFYSKYVQPNLAAYPRKVRRVQNPFVSEMASARYLMRHAAPWASAYTSPDALASHLATWLTFMEFLKTRRTTLSYAGYAPWTNYQIIGVAVRPVSGNQVRYFDFYMLDEVQPDVTIGGEIWTRAVGYYLFRLDVLTLEVSYQLPIQPNMEGIVVDTGNTNTNPPSNSPNTGSTTGSYDMANEINVSGFWEL
ncbi:hypothetical protein [Thermus phage P23-45]|uniref:Uncharacterized protein n=1 Tax=Thermus virus P23-45 TaxID=2914006 RepID=A7XXD5_BP234|nr:hypothetical protein P23p100 [Thermus phage P23-45]ABU96933.1 hypothetical protein P23p100 [Thermus phage P23-45]UYB98491.1 hypothetical protein [Thermus phage P23-45]